MDYTAEYTEKVRKDGSFESDVLIKDDKGNPVEWKDGRPLTLAVTGYKDEAGRKAMVAARLRTLLPKLEKEKELPEHPVMKKSETIEATDLASEE